MDLIEFGRMIHAEMSAISDAARLGRGVKEALLFCTTFPCHICAKHIVSSGIQRVIYFEPYPKSYAEDLYSDAISLNEKQVSNKVLFRPFIGIAPVRYKELFGRGRRKDQSGNFIEWADGEPKLYVKYTIASYMNNETAITAMLDKKLEELKASSTVDVK